MTGAAGTVASHIRPYSYREDDTWTDIRPGPGVVALRLDDADAVAKVMRGHDTVVHAVGANWGKPDHDIEAAMIPPLQCVLDAMTIADVRRIILLSSMHVVADYELGQPISPECHSRTSTFYGQMHVRREEMVRASGFDASIIRIGVVTPAPRGTHRDRSIWISPRDMAACISYAADIANRRSPILWGCSGTNDDQAWIHSDGRAPTADNAADFPLRDAGKWGFIGGPLACRHPSA